MFKKNIKRIIKYPVTVCMSTILNYKSSMIIEKQRSKVIDHSPIKVGFIVQMPEIWDKQESVYISMLSDDRFDPWLIIVPHYDFEKDLLGNYGSEKEFFLNQCQHKSYILALNNVYVDIKNFGFDYIFYQRPYNGYLPKTLKSSYLVNFTRICYIPYATPEIKKTVIYPSDFFRDIYLGFMEDESAACQNEKKYSNEKKQRFFNIGYPSFEKCLSNTGKRFSNSVLWTPRWSYHPKTGGSHFFEYYEVLSNFDWKDHTFIVRPHQMMWENFIKEKLISAGEIEIIKNTWCSKGIVQDSNKSIIDTFKDISILISDRSSVIPMFFLSGKPIIYCPLNCDYGSLFMNILPGLYIVNNEDELICTLKQLLSGYDPLQNVRHKIIKEHFSQHINATKSIIDTIIRDATGD